MSAMIPIETYRDRPVAVFGLGDSGIAAARALIAGGAIVSAWDDGEASRANAARQGVTLKEPCSLDWASQAALVLAPGVPLTHPVPHPVASRALAAQCPIIGDIQLFSDARCALPPHAVVAISGTNGKSTTTALITHLINACSGDAVACGNIGEPILGLDPLPRDGVYVIEMSSYQIDLTHRLRPEVAILLNITADHLDRHGSMGNYVSVKRRLFDRQGPTDQAIVGIDDDYGVEILEMIRASGHQASSITVAGKSPEGVSVESGKLWDPAVSFSEPVCDLSEISTLRGSHNWQNAAAAYSALRALGHAPDAIAAALRTFPGLPHRLEMIGDYDGVQFINDSKATNAEAAARALDCVDNVHWIVGGVPKEGGIESLGPWMSKIRRAYLVGESQVEFSKFLTSSDVPFEMCGALDNAVQSAAMRAKPGDVVLLSPACASFDQYRNFAVRGDHFRSLVADLKQQVRA